MVVIIVEIVDLGGWLVRGRFYGRFSVQRYNYSEKNANKKEKKRINDTFKMYF